MKYELILNRIDKIVFKYLDLNLKGLERKKAFNHNGFVLIYPGEKCGILSFKIDGTLHTASRLIEEISSTFGLEKYESKELICRWASDRLQLEVKYSFYGSTGDLMVNDYYN